MQLFYNPTLDNSAKQFTFPPDESKHIIRVLRKSEGDIVHITNGKGYLFEAEILEPNQKKCKARIISHQKSIPKRYKLHMVVAPTKMNDRYEWFLEKARLPLLFVITLKERPSNWKEWSEYFNLP